MEALWSGDAETFRAVNSGLGSGVLDAFFLAVTCLGLGWVQVLLVAPMLFSSSLRAMGWACLLAFVSSGIAVQVLKRVFPSLRPTNLPGVRQAWDEAIYMGSYPSGHTATAFAIATVLAMKWPGPRRRVVGCGALMLAFLVGVSRVYGGVHFPTDAIGGALLGIGCGLLICSLPLFEKGEAVRA